MKSVSQAAKLLNSVTTRVRLLRSNREVELDRKDVVPGDVLILTSSYTPYLCFFFLYIDDGENIQAEMFFPAIASSFRPRP